MKNQIKTEFTLYSIKNVDGNLPTELKDGEKHKLMAMRNSDCSIVGTAETIESDVKLPNTRVQGSPERGGESNSGDVSTEWNIDEQDDWLASVMCSDWTNNTEYLSGDGSNVGDVTENKSLRFGMDKSSYTMIKHYKQKPEEYQRYNREEINQLALTFDVDAFVKMVWSFMGSNNPIKSDTDVITDEEKEFVEYGTEENGGILTTKSFTTRTGFLKIAPIVDDVIGDYVPHRQCPSFSLTINNNMEATKALFETEAIEQSLGDFDVSGSIDTYMADEFARNFYNDGVNGEDKAIQISVERIIPTTIGGKKVNQKTSYTITLKVHLDVPEESKDGNKFKNTINFNMNTSDGLLIEKIVETVK